MSETQKHTKPNVPNLRFPGFEGEWEHFALGQLCEEFQSGKGITSEQIKEIASYPVYGGNGLRGYADSYNHEGVYTLIGRQGAKCGNVRLVSGKTYITEHAIAVKANRDNVTEFLNWLFIKMNLGQYSDQSAQPGLAVNKLVRLTAFVPKKAEQKKIAELLALIDARITLQSKVIEDYKILKSTLCERCYITEGRESHNLGELLQQVSSRNRGRHITNVLSVSNRYGFIEQKEQFEDRAVASDDTSNYKIVELNDFAYNPARINVGSIARLKDWSKGIVSPMYICFRTTGSLIPEYLEHFFNTNRFQIELNKRLEGSVRQCLSYEGLCNISIPLPSLKEQEIIVDHIGSIVKKIEVENQILALLQAQKSFLLQKLFI